MYLKIHKTPESIIISVCDENLIGKSFKEGKFKICISERFYKGKRHKERDIIEILKTASNVNIVGEKSVNAALKAGIIDRKNIIKIKKVPHAISCKL